MIRNDVLYRCCKHGTVLEPVNFQQVAGDINGEKYFTFSYIVPVCEKCIEEKAKSFLMTVEPKLSATAASGAKEEE